MEEEHSIGTALGMKTYLTHYILGMQSNNKTYYKS